MLSLGLQCATAVCAGFGAARAVLPFRVSVLANVGDEPHPLGRTQFFAGLSVSGREGHHSHYEDVESDEDAKSDSEIHPHRAEHDKAGGRRCPDLNSPDELAAEEGSLSRRD